MGGDNFKPNTYSKGMYGLMWPGFENMFRQFNNMSGMPGYGMPQAPTMPSMQGVLSGVSPYSMYGYDVPDTKQLMPTKKWWGSLAPGVKAGAWAPFEEGKQSLLETMGGSGMADNPRGGYSGAAGAALGEYMADATPAYQMNLFSMSQPGMMAGWQGQLGKNQYMAGLQNQQSQQLWQNRLTENQTDYQNQMNQANQNYAGQMQAWQMPWQMAQNYNNFAPSGAYHSDGGGTLNSVLGAGASILGPAALGFGLGGFGGAGMGALAGLGGGKGKNPGGSGGKYGNIMPYQPGW